MKNLIQYIEFKSYIIFKAYKWKQINSFYFRVGKRLKVSNAARKSCLGWSRDPSEHYKEILKCVIKYSLQIATIVCARVFSNNKLNADSVELSFGH